MPTSLDYLRGDAELKVEIAKSNDKRVMSIDRLLAVKSA